MSVRVVGQPVPGWHAFCASPKVKVYLNCAFGCNARMLARCFTLSVPWHRQDTGGFFIAVLEKVAPTPPLEDPKMGHRCVTGGSCCRALHMGWCNRYRMPTPVLSLFDGCMLDDPS
jgi:hypothetical protein